MQSKATLRQTAQVSKWEIQVPLWRKSNHPVQNTPRAGSQETRLVKGNKSHQSEENISYYADPDPSVSGNVCLPFSLTHNLRISFHSQTSSRSILTPPSPSIYALPTHAGDFRTSLGYTTNNSLVMFLISPCKSALLIPTSIFFIHTSKYTSCKVWWLITTNRQRNDSEY